MITNGEENTHSLLFFPESKVFKKYNILNLYSIRKTQKHTLNATRKIQKESIMKILVFPQP